MRLRSVLGIALAVGVAVASEAADPYRLDESHSSVEFKIRHLIGNVTGRFGDFEGTLLFDAADPTRSSIRISIRAASIDTAAQQARITQAALDLEQWRKRRDDKRARTK